MAIKFYNTREFEEITGIDSTTIAKWCSSHKINAINTAAGTSAKKSSWQIPETEIEHAKQIYRPKAKQISVLKSDNPLNFSVDSHELSIPNLNVSVPVGDKIIEIIKQALPTLLPQALQEYLTQTSKPIIPEVSVKESFANPARSEIKFYIENDLYRRLKTRATEMNTSIAILIDELLKDGIEQMENK